MDSICKSIRVFCYQLKRELLTVRTKLLFLMVGIFIYSNIEPIVNFSKAVNIKVTPWAFSHLVNDFTCQPVFMIGLIFLLSNAPFRSDTYRYIVARSGKVEWEIGNLLYIFTMTFLYTSFMFLVSVISLGTRISISSNWGKIWGTLAKTDAGMQFSVKFIINDFIIGTYKPLLATLYSFILEWMCFLWLGYLIYLFNLFAKRAVGVIVAGVFILLDIMIYNSWVESAYLISPVTLAQLSTFTKGNLKYGLTLEYAFVFFLTGIMLFIISTLIVANRKDKIYE